MSESEHAATEGLFGIGTWVEHPMFGKGKVVAYEEHNYVVLFKGGEAKRVAFNFAAMQAEQLQGDPELDRIRQAVCEVLGERGWIDIDVELGKRWTGGTLRLIPGKEGTQEREVPIETFFKKIVGVRDRLRVLEQKINAHSKLSGEEKLEFQGYITRCYGSLTTFNLLFSAKEGQIKGQGKEE